MSSSFAVVQAATAVGAYVGTPKVAFAANVSYGNIILAAWGNTSVNFGDNPPTSVTDSLGNTYVLWGQSNWTSANEPQVTQLWIAQGTSGAPFGGIKGGACTVTFTGAVGGDSGGPSLIVAELEVPDFYEIFAQFNVDNHNPQTRFRAMANNGAPGGAASSDTGQDGITCTPNGSVEEFTNDNVCSALLMDQFFDAYQVMVNFNDYYPLLAGPWTCSGTIIGETLQPPLTEESGTAANASMILAGQDFPYLNGPLIANCGDDPNGTVGVAYGPMGDGSYLIASGGMSPYTWAIVGGSLPPGLSLTASGADAGLISGTPTAAGRFQFTAQATDADGSTATITCVISICPAGGGAGSNPFGWTG